MTSSVSRALLAGFVLALAAGLAGVTCTKNRAVIEIAAPIDTLARGRYLVTVHACGDCHTPGSFYGAPDTMRTFAGSELGWRGPWGVSYPRNLTPDPETGIGSWSEAQVVNAIRTGQRPDGRLLLPPMPWPSYSALTDEDAYAMAAYLKSLPPVRHKVPDPVPPNGPARGSFLTLPPPPAWDAPKRAPAGAIGSQPDTAGKR